MLRFSVVLVFVLLSSLTQQQQQSNFEITSNFQGQLDLVLTGLVNELNLVNTTFQDNTRLQMQLDFNWDILSILLKDLMSFNNVIMGQGNIVIGSKDIVIGNYNSITGSNNFVFTDYFTGRVSGSLIIDRYRVQMDKKHLASTRPDLVIFRLTPS